MTLPAASLDYLGRCCGRLPFHYTGQEGAGGPHKFCVCCRRAFDLKTGRQIPNWAWNSDDGETFTDKIHSAREAEPPK